MQEEKMVRSAPIPSSEKWAKIHALIEKAHHDEETMARNTDSYFAPIITHTLMINAKYAVIRTSKRTIHSESVSFIV